MFPLDLESRGQWGQGWSLAYLSVFQAEVEGNPAASYPQREIIRCWLALGKRGYYQADQALTALDGFLVKRLDMAARGLRVISDRVYQFLTEGKLRSRCYSVRKTYVLASSIEAYQAGLRGTSSRSVRIIH